MAGQGHTVVTLVAHIAWQVKVTQWLQQWSCCVAGQGHTMATVVARCLAGQVHTVATVVVHAGCTRSDLTVSVLKDYWLGGNRRYDYTSCVLYHISIIIIPQSE